MIGYLDSCLREEITGVGVVIDGGRLLPASGQTGEGAAKGDITLKRNGVYQARAGSRTVICKVDSRAQEGGPLLSRLVVF